MNTHYKINNRNNGKSKYHNIATDRINNQGNNYHSKYNNKDLGLFQMARALNVKVNTRQRIRWFFNINNNLDDVALRQEIESLCSRCQFAGKGIITLKQERNVMRLIIDTPLFLFTLDNIAQFSNKLYTMSMKNSIFYERWEVVPRQEGWLKRFTRLFS